MKSVTVALLGLFALAATSRDELKLGDAVPDVTMKDYDGKELKLSDLRADAEKKREGQVVVVYFQSEKCPAAILPTEIRKVASAWSDPKAGVKFIAIYAYPHDTEQNIAKFIKDNQLAYSNVFDTEKKLRDHFGAKQVNTTFVLNKEGKLVYRGAFGAVNKKREVTKATVAEAVEAAQKGTEAPKSDGRFAG
ncbi:MAG TPA: TlpA disulfide reductase family protein [Planctomycetota bacterium]|nr:TlpA disulfide reductase family protein [Planctomycetota bacterium]